MSLGYHAADHSRPLGRLVIDRTLAVVNTRHD
jgi:hypothetical protein